MAKEKSTAAAEATVKVRVLSDCAYGACGEVAMMPATELESAKARAMVDDDPDAVAYAEGLLAPASPATPTS